MEEIKTEEVLNASLEFFNDVKWELINHNKISKDMFLKIRAKHEKAFATFLGGQGSLGFYMFKPLPWTEFRAVQTGAVDRYDVHEHILKTCLLWPVVSDSTLATMDAGTVLTLVYAILAQSSFLKDPSQALKMVIEI